MAVAHTHSPNARVGIRAAGQVRNASEGRQHNTISRIPICLIRSAWAGSRPVMNQPDRTARTRRTLRTRRSFNPRGLIRRAVDTNHGAPQHSISRPSSPRPSARPARILGPGSAASSSMTRIFRNGQKEGEEIASAEKAKFGNGWRKRVSKGKERDQYNLVICHKPLLMCSEYTILICIRQYLPGNNFGGQFP